MTMAESNTTVDEYMLSTTDNPFSPFTQFDDWYGFDESHGYHSSALLARILVSSDDLSEADQAQARQDAIDEIVKYNVLGVSRKVKSSDFKV